MHTITVGRNRSTELFDSFLKITQQGSDRGRSPLGEGPINKPHPGAKNKKYQLSSYGLILKEILEDWIFERKVTTGKIGEKINTRMTQRKQKR